ncbi:unnamed protein product [Amoebophrya sp. A25]|nr:unnamed protein product [Amoebophrya sp. A25]|eukprot:GSA25T00008457001.1
MPERLLCLLSSLVVVALTSRNVYTVKLQRFADESDTDAGVREIRSSEYYGKVTLGGQDFAMVFDTGSGNIVVPSVECTDEACQRHRRYNASESATSKQLAFAEEPETEVTPGKERDIVTISYGTGQLSGVFVRDRLCVGNDSAADGAEEAKLCAMINFVAASEETTDPFGKVQFDGIFGLGLPDMSEGPHFNAVDRMITSNFLRDSVFSIYLRKDEDKGEEEEDVHSRVTPCQDPSFGCDNSTSFAGEITFGGYRTQRMSSEIIWVPVSHPSFWQVEMDDVVLNNVVTGLCDGGCQAAVDTGTSLLAGPSHIVHELTEKLNVAADCSNWPSLPDLGFLFGDTILNLKPQDYVERHPEEGCSLALMALDVPPPKGPLFVFGEPFLKKYYTIFDRARLRLGLALANHDIIAEETTTITADGSVTVQAHENVTIITEGDPHHVAQQRSTKKVVVVDAVEHLRARGHTAKRRPTRRLNVHRNRKTPIAGR